MIWGKMIYIVLWKLPSKFVEITGKNFSFFQWNSWKLQHKKFECTKLGYLSPRTMNLRVSPGNKEHYFKHRKICNFFQFIIISSDIIDFTDFNRSSVKASYKPNFLHLKFNLVASLSSSCDHKKNHLKYTANILAVLSTDFGSVTFPTVIWL